MPEQTGTNQNEDKRMNKTDSAIVVANAISQQDVRHLAALFFGLLLLAGLIGLATIAMESK